MIKAARRAFAGGVRCTSEEELPKLRVPAAPVSTWPVRPMLGKSSKAPAAAGSRLTPFCWAAATLEARPSTVRAPITSPVVLSTTRTSMAM